MKKKIYCEKCGTDITLQVSQKLEKNEIGRVTCPHCQKQQSRYIAEADLLMYLGFMEIVYFLLSFVTAILFRNFPIGVISIIIPAGMIIGAILLTQKFRYGLYTTGYIKHATMNNEQPGDPNQIARSVRWQFVLLFALVITFVTENRFFWFFVAATIVAIAFTFIKIKLAVKNEK